MGNSEAKSAQSHSTTQPHSRQENKSTGRRGSGDAGPNKGDGDDDWKPINSDTVAPPYGWVPKDPKWDRAHPPPIEPLRPVPSVVLPPDCTTLSCEELVDRIRGCLVGNALGDAVGLATEFMNKDAVRAAYGDMHDFQFVQMKKDSHRYRFARGDWTDDTDQLLCILDSLLRHGGEIVESDIAYRIKYWSFNGYPELKDVTGLGLGQLTGEVLDEVGFEEAPQDAARRVWERVTARTGRPPQANGAVMRTAVLGIPWFYDRQRTAEAAQRVCRITHWDPLCVASCVAVCDAIAALLRGEQDTAAITAQAIDAALAVLPADAEAEREALRRHLTAATLDELQLDGRAAIGYTLKTAGAGFWALRCPLDFRQAILSIAREAGDADTNGAVAGALLGCRLGFGALPADWIRTSPHMDWLLRRVDRLLAMLGLPTDPPPSVPAPRTALGAFAPVPVQSPAGTEPAAEPAAAPATPPSTAATAPPPSPTAAAPAPTPAPVVTVVSLTPEQVARLQAPEPAADPEPSPLRQTLETALGTAALVAADVREALPDGAVLRHAARTVVHDVLVAGTVLRHAVAALDSLTDAAAQADSEVTAAVAASALADVASPTTPATAAAASGSGAAPPPSTVAAAVQREAAATVSEALAAAARGQDAPSGTTSPPPPSALEPLSMPAPLTVVDALPAVQALAAVPAVVTMQPASSDSESGAGTAPAAGGEEAMVPVRSEQVGATART